MTILFGRKLEVVHKQVGGYLTRCARDAASIALNYESSVSQSVTCAKLRYRAAKPAKKKSKMYISTGGEVTDLGQSLKKTAIFLCFPIFKTEK